MTRRTFSVRSVAGGWIVAMLIERPGEPSRLKLAAGPFLDRLEAERALAAMGEP